MNEPIPTSELPLADDVEMMRSMFAGTIHNIGNILAMASLAVTELEEAHGSESPPLIAMILDEMLPTLEGHVAAGTAQEFLHEHPQGREYLAAIRQLLQQQRKIIIQHRGTLESLSDKLSHISQIISLQQQLLLGLGTEELVALDQLVDDALKMMGPSASRHGVDVARQLGSTPPLRVDPSAMTQVVINLIKNAIEALDELKDDREKRIEVMTGVIEDVGGNGRPPVAVCMVIDNGPGMSDAVLEKAFDFGFSTKPRTRGERGVGLSFCRRTVERHGGTVDVATKVNAGTRFTIRIPCVPDAAPPEQQTTPPPEIS